MPRQVGGKFGVRLARRVRQFVRSDLKTRLGVRSSGSTWIHREPQLLFSAMSCETITRSVGQRPAHDLKAAAAASLFDSGYAALNFVGCEVRGDQVILQGSVPTYYLKQLAQAFVQRVAGVGRVENRLAVRKPGESRRAHS